MKTQQFETRDSGEHEQFDTGSKRDTRKGKGRYDLISTVGLKRLAGMYERGADKYTDRNWEKGQPISRLMDSLIRHAFNYMEGEQTEDHLAAVAWNAFAAMHMEEKMPQMQDLDTRK